jgi:hypothetical protein
LKEPPVVSITGIDASGADEKRLGRHLAFQVQKRLEIAEFFDVLRASTTQLPVVTLAEWED